MPKQKINCKHPKTGKRVLGCLDTNTKKVSFIGGIIYALSYLKKVDKNGIGFFETHENGELLQKKGEYK